MTSWLILTATLPTSPSGLRVKVWRALKATHCATLREGVYILPLQAGSAAAFPALEATIRAAGAQAHLLEVPARDEAQEAVFRALFDRTGHYAEFQQALKAAHSLLSAAPEAEARRGLRQLDQQLKGLLACDFFPAAPAEQARAGLTALQAALERRWSPGEPVATGQAVPLLDVAHYQGCTWATRARPWVDRIATAWLITRFVDRRPTFVWLADARQAPRDALTFDLDGARFTHVGEQVTFEVVAQAFDLLAQPGLRRLAALVHVLDVGGPPQDEAPGLDLLVRGLQALHADDDALLAAALPLFDTVLAGLAPDPGTT
ncbi:hypothetical protein C7444_11059 [Sphaerotilus hippei]|uniref:Chromate resistance exported protein n=1 Tax=Sphaerotilus hippei TaxID=744406 RepID=A0A318GYR8_9BURK|nr:chromate resistance protein ChrB domain-containing protein [Sphaerotilus hippei]PXW95214.1 hypothetical protein C7444_11059 [Sphaerotilus hippei]